MEKTIYNIKLHESISIDTVIILRVPGGWIYDEYDDNKDITTTSTFVPYNDEFNEVVTTIGVDDSNSNSTRPLTKL